MTRLLTAFAVVLITAAALSTAHSAIIINDNFEYANQAAFEAAWVPIGTVAPTSAELSTEQATSGTKSAKIVNTTTDGQMRNRATFTETGILPFGARLVWSFDIREHNFVGNGQRIFNTLQDGTAPTGTNQLVAMGTNNTLLTNHDGGANNYMARILGYTPTYLPPSSGTNPATSSGAWFKLNDPGAPLRTPGTTWRELKVEMNVDPTDGIGIDYRFYVNGILSKTILNVGTSTAVTNRSWENIALGSALSGTQTVYYDDMYLELIPFNYTTTVDSNAIVSGGMVDFGTAMLGDIVQKTLVVQNNGSAAINLTGVSAINGFSVVSSPVSIAAGAMGSILLQMDTSAPASLLGSLSFTTNVPGQTSYSLELKGAVIPEPSTFALAGLALVSVVFAARRRVR